MPSISNHHQQTAVMPTVNGPFKDHLMLKMLMKILGSATSTLKEFLKRSVKFYQDHEKGNNRCNCLATHTKDDNDLQKRGFIAGYIVIGAIHHKQYGIATYVKENIDDTMVVHKVNSGNTQVLSTKIGSITCNECV